MTPENLGLSDQKGHVPVMWGDRLGNTAINDGLRKTGDFVAGYTFIIDAPQQECREGDNKPNCAVCSPSAPIHKIQQEVLTGC